MLYKQIYINGIENNLDKSGFERIYSVHERKNPQASTRGLIFTVNTPTEDTELLTAGVIVLTG